MSNKIGFKYKKGRIVVSNKLVYPEAVNEQMYTLVSNGLIENVLPVFAKKVHKYTVLEGGIEGYVPLGDYLKDIISKRTFLRIITLVVNTVKLCESDKLTPTNLDLDLNRVLIKPQTIEIKVIYWPVVNNQIAAPVNHFFQEAGERVLLPENEDSGFIDEYREFFSTLAPFSFNNFEKMIASFNSIPAAHSVPKEPTVCAVVRTDAPPTDHTNIEYDPFREIER